jgi:hypothetical protein
MLRQKLSTAWHFGQSGILRAAVVEGSTRIAANGVRRASFIRCFQVTYSGWAEILLKADLSKPDDRLEDSLTKATSDRDDPAAAPSPLGKPSGCRHDGSQGAYRMKPKLWGVGVVRVLLRKQSQFEPRIIVESIADRLVFNRSQKGNLRPPWPWEEKGTPSAGGWTVAWGPGRHSQRETKNTRPAKRNICGCYTPRRVEINVTAARPSAGALGARTCPNGRLTFASPAFRTPVSISNCLITGKNIGKSAKAAISNAPLDSQSPCKWGVAAEIRWRQEQGISNEITGKLV